MKCVMPRSMGRVWPWLEAPLVCSTAAMAQSVDAAESAATSYFTATLENDLLVGKDSGYTNGIAVGWTHAGFSEFDEKNLPGWIHALARHLYVGTAAGKRRAVSYAIGQAMQTPGDITVVKPPPDDAPYAGLLAWSVSLQAYDERVVDRWELTLGVVGPLSGAEPAQKLIHNVIGTDEPRGWENQIENEPVFAAGAERLWRIGSHALSDSTAADLIAVAGGEIGNLQSRVALGMGLRLGRGLERSFPSVAVLPGRRANWLAGAGTNDWNVFLNVQGMFVANDISIDGNSFRESPSVPLEHWQAQAVAGLAFNWQRWALLLSVAVATDRFEGQQETGRFGSLSVTRRL
jgi:lipid A 3-O-deacylase